MTSRCLDAVIQPRRVLRGGPQAAAARGL